MITNTSSPTPAGAHRCRASYGLRWALALSCLCNVVALAAALMTGGVVLEAERFELTDKAGAPQAWLARKGADAVELVFAEADGRRRLGLTVDAGGARLAVGSAVLEVDQSGARVVVAQDAQRVVLAARPEGATLDLSSPGGSVHIGSTPEANVVVCTTPANGETGQPGTRVTLRSDAQAASLTTSYQDVSVSLKAGSGSSELTMIQAELPRVSIRQGADQATLELGTPRSKLRLAVGTTDDGITLVESPGAKPLRWPESTP